jgi:hypothetical protein
VGSNHIDRSSGIMSQRESARRRGGPFLRHLQPQRAGIRDSGFSIRGRTGRLLRSRRRPNAESLLPSPLSRRSALSPCTLAPERWQAFRFSPVRPRYLRGNAEEHAGRSEMIVVVLQNTYVFCKKTYVLWKNTNSFRRNTLVFCKNTACFWRKTLVFQEKTACFWRNTLVD